ncbi:MAG: BBP7 family outer membrane beta-barrel protein, partial [Bacteroidales bacterium]|nr:BBP7 family outer membrane beta-barrel protein [Bacteroidales bacterium]
AGATVPGPSSRPRLDVYGEVLLGWIPRANMPALLTTSSAPYNGIIGRGDTRVILAGNSLEDRYHTGGRFGFDYWFGCQQKWGFGGDFWFLGQNTGSFLADSTTYPLLARPFVNLNQNQQFSELIAFPNYAVGTGLVTTSSEAWGGGFEFMRNVASGSCANLNFLMGFRYMRLAESLSVQETFARQPGAVSAPGVPDISRGVVIDQFDTTNEFYGANFGFKGEIRRGRFFVGGRASIAIGEVFQSLDINGMQSIQSPNGAVGVFPGGLLALPGANIGNFKHDRFATMPEIGIKMGVYITPHLKFSVGYNLIYLSSVIRPGDQIDPGLDVSRIPNFPLTPAAAPLVYTRPQPTFRDTGLTTQWISLGLQYDFY